MTPVVVVVYLFLFALALFYIIHVYTLLDIQNNSAPLR